MTRPVLRIVRADEDPTPLANLPSWAPPPPIAPRFVPVTPPVRRRNRLLGGFVGAVVLVAVGVLVGGGIAVGAAAVIWRGVGR